MISSAFIEIIPRRGFPVNSIDIDNQRYFPLGNIF